MVSFFLVFLSTVIEDLNIQPFETSQRIKGLGVEFSRIISDTVTDLIYEPGLTAFLSHSLFLTEFQKYSTYTSDPVYRFGYFCPRLFRGFSGSLFLEGSVNEFSWGWTPWEGADNSYWVRSIGSITRLLNGGENAISFGGDITSGIKKNGYYYDNIQKFTRNDYKVFLSFLKETKNFQGRITGEYINNNTDSEYCYSQWDKDSSYSNYQYGDSLTIIEELWQEINEGDSTTERNKNGFFGITTVGNILLSENIKINIFASIKTAKDMGREYYSGNYYYYGRIYKETKIWQDSTTIDCDTTTIHADTNTNYIHNKNTDFYVSEINFGVGQENKMNDKFSLFTGLKLNYRNGQNKETIAFPMGFEYKTSSFLCARAGVTIYGNKTDDNIHLSNTYYLGVGFYPANGLSINISNKGELVEPDDWEIGVIKTF
ncbi:MAG: hypothetical protein PHE49_00640 [bacterium]|nr:hypothetical protein [bacterium]